MEEEEEEETEREMEGVEHTHRPLRLHIWLRSGCLGFLVWLFGVFVPWQTELNVLRECVSPHKLSSRKVFKLHKSE